MRGNRGSFINRLIEKIKRFLKQRKIKKEKLTEEKKLETKEKSIKKKKEEEIIIHFINQKKLNNSVKLDNKKVNKKVGIKLPKEIKNKKEVINPIKSKNKEIVKEKPIEKKINIIKEHKNKKIKNNKQNKQIKNIPKQKENIRIENKDNKNNIQQIQNKPVFNNKMYIIKKHKPKKKGIKEVNIIKVKKKINNNIKSNDLIKEINKIISNNKELLNNIKNEISNIEYELNKTKNIKKINDLELKLREIKLKIEKLIKEYYYIKEGNLDKLKYTKLENIINDIKKINPNINFNDLISLPKLNLDYYNDMINTKINSDTLEDKLYYKKEVVKTKNNIFDKEKNELNNLKIINSRLSNQISKNKETLKYFNDMIKNIEPEKIIVTQHNYLSNILRNTANLLGTFISIPFLKRPSNIPLFTFGLFTLNNSIRNMRAINSKKQVVKYLPSDDYTDKILYYKNNFDSVVYLINDSISQLEFFREEYISNFGNYYDYNEYNKFLNEIDNMKIKLLEQQKNIDKLKKEYDNTYNKNNAKVLKIKNMK